MGAKKEFVDNLVTRGPRDPNSFDSKIGATTLAIPASAWSLARGSGFTFESVIDFTVEDVFEALKTTCAIAAITHIDISGLWRPGQTPPHPPGRGVDMTFVRRRLDGDATDQASFARDNTPPHAPVDEPAAAKAMFDALQSIALVTQVMHPWRMLVAGRVERNALRTALERQHRTHLHFTVRIPP